MRVISLVLKNIGGYFSPNLFSLYKDEKEAPLNKFGPKNYYDEDKELKNGSNKKEGKP